MATFGDDLYVSDKFENDELEIGLSLPFGDYENGFITLKDVVCLVNHLVSIVNDNPNAKTYFEVSVTRKTQ